VITPESQIRQLKSFVQRQRFIQSAYAINARPEQVTDESNQVKIAILFNSDEPSWFEQEKKLAEGLNWIFGDAQIVNLNTSNLQDSFEAVSRGQLVFARDEIMRVKIEHGIVGEYLDTSYLRSICQGGA